MVTDLTISIVAVGIAVTSLVLTIWSNHRQAHANALIANHTAILAVEHTLGDFPNALRFHGIDPAELELADVTPEEFGYLLNSFTIASTYHRVTTPRLIRRFSSNSYRFRMCESAATRRAWPLIRKLMEPSSFRERVDNTIAYIEKSKPSVGNSNGK